MNRTFTHHYCKKLDIIINEDVLICKLGQRNIFKNGRYIIDSKKRDIAVINFQNGTIKFPENEDLFGLPLAQGDDGKMYTFKNDEILEVTYPEFKIIQPLKMPKQIIESQGFSFKDRILVVNERKEITLFNQIENSNIFKLIQKRKVMSNRTINYMTKTRIYTSNVDVLQQLIMFKIENDKKMISTKNSTIYKSNQYQHHNNLKEFMKMGEITTKTDLTSLPSTFMKPFIKMIGDWDLNLIKNVSSIERTYACSYYLCYYKGVSLMIVHLSKFIAVYEIRLTNLRLIKKIPFLSFNINSRMNYYNQQYQMKLFNESLYLEGNYEKEYYVIKFSFV